MQDLHGIATVREIHSAIDSSMLVITFRSMLTLLVVVNGSDLKDFFKVHAVGPTSIHIKCRQVANANFSMQR